MFFSWSWYLFTQYRVEGLFESLVSEVVNDRKLNVVCAHRLSYFEIFITFLKN